LISINARRSADPHKSDMAPRTQSSSLPPLAVARIAERLLAHAQLCREIALASLNAEIAAKLMTVAEDCTRTAEELQPARMVNTRRRRH